MPSAVVIIFLTSILKAFRWAISVEKLLMSNIIFKYILKLNICKGVFSSIKPANVKT